MLRQTDFAEALIERDTTHGLTVTPAVMSHSTLGGPASRNGLAPIPRKSASTVNLAGRSGVRSATYRAVSP
jgi:hypothetical protein